jgi:hypothetical protein
MAGMPSSFGTSQQMLQARNEYAECRRTLERARTTLRLHAKTLDMMRLALLRIDAIFWIGWERVVGFK